MASNSCFKHTLCVEWTTELPFDEAPRESPRFSLEGLEWYLKFTYSWRYELRFMKVKSDSRLNKIIVITTSIKDASIDDEPVLIERETFGNSCQLLWSRSRETISDQIPNILAIGKCTIVCLFHNKEAHFEKKDDSAQTTARLPTLSSDFSTLLKDETFSDVRLTCEGRTFSAHRCILAARSEVFAAMFRNKMAETEAGVVDIKDVSLEVLELLLEYVYSGEMPDLSESTARRLYEEADKYAIHSLRDACSDWMVEYQTPDNCLDLLVLADEHSDKKFVEAVVCFAAEHLASLSLESWSAFKERYPLLVLPVLEKRLADSLPRAV